MASNEQTNMAKLAVGQTTTITCIDNNVQALYRTKKQRAMEMFGPKLNLQEIATNTQTIEANENATSDAKREEGEKGKVNANASSDNNDNDNDIDYDYDNEVIEVIEISDDDDNDKANDKAMQIKPQSVAKESDAKHDKRKSKQTGTTTSNTIGLIDDYGYHCRLSKKRAYAALMEFQKWMISTLDEDKDEVDDNQDFVVCKRQQQKQKQKSKGIATKDNNNNDNMIACMQKLRKDSRINRVELNSSSAGEARNEDISPGTGTGSNGTGRSVELAVCPIRLNRGPNGWSVSKKFEALVIVFEESVMDHQSNYKPAYLIRWREKVPKGDIFWTYDDFFNFPKLWFRYLVYRSEFNEWSRLLVNGEQVVKIRDQIDQNCVKLKRQNGLNESFHSYYRQLIDGADEQNEYEANLSLSAKSLIIDSRRDEPTHSQRNNFIRWNQMFVFTYAEYVRKCVCLKHSQHDSSHDHLGVAPAYKTYKKRPEHEYDLPDYCLILHALMRDKDDYGFDWL